MALSTVALLNAVHSLVSGLGGVGAAYKGVPEQIDATLGAYVTVGPQQYADLTMGGPATHTESTLARIRVVFAYAVEGQEANAEAGIAGALDALRDALSANRTLGGACTYAQLDAAVSGQTDYEPLLGQEFRRYPVDVVAYDEEVA